MCLQTGPGDLKITKHLKFDIRQIFLRIFEIMEKNHIFREFWKSSAAYVKIIVCFFFYLIMVDKNQQNSISLFCGGKYFMTIPHFRFYCEVLTINLTAFDKDNFTFRKKNSDF